MEMNEISKINKNVLKCKFRVAAQESDITYLLIPYPPPHDQYKSALIFWLAPITDALNAQTSSNMHERQSPPPCDSCDPPP